jgi:hypothetical protein
MKLWIVLLTSFGLAALAGFSFMAAAFMGGGVANRIDGQAHPRLIITLNACLFLLPGSGAFAILMLWVAYAKHWSACHYAWAGFPVLMALGYGLFIGTLMK